MCEELNWVLWYSMDAKLTVPREMLLPLRGLDPRARIPSKTLPDGHLSNLNVRAAIREFMEGSLESLRLAPGTYFSSQREDVIVGLDDTLRDIGCEFGAALLDDLARPEAWPTCNAIRDGAIRRIDSLNCDLETAYARYKKKKTALNGKRVLDLAVEIEQTVERYQSITLYRTKLSAPKLNPELEQEIRNQKELHVNW